MIPIVPTGLGLSPVVTPDTTGAALPMAALTNVGPGATIDSFGTMLSQAIGAIDSTQAQADAAATQLVSGQSTDLHTVMVDMQEAKITFDLGVQVRNTLLNGYNQMMQMQM
jgi:flagellar hook-basal body complex protein FliE